MNTYLFDDRDGLSVYLNAESWAVAERLARDNGLQLVGEYVESHPGPLWLTEGETEH